MAATPAGHPARPARRRRAPLAGWSHLVVEQARRLGADVPDGVAACSMVWSRWADRLAEWANGGEPE